MQSPQIEDEEMEKSEIALWLVILVFAFVK